MWEADGFAEAAKKDFVLVSLDFPQGAELKAKIPNPKRNDELKKKYGIRGYPTVLVMTPDGEVFGKTGYARGGPEPYLENLRKISSAGKADLKDVKKLTKALDGTKGNKRNRALDAIIAKLNSMDPESPFIATLADVVSEVYPNAKGKRREACVEALVNVGRVDSDILAAAKEIDFDGSKGLWAKAVNSLAEGVNSDETFEIAYNAITELFTKSKDVAKNPGASLCQKMSIWSFRMKDDEAAAVMWAERGLAMILDSDDPNDERLREFFEDMLEE